MGHIASSTAQAMAKCREFAYLQDQFFLHEINQRLPDIGGHIMSGLDSEAVPHGLLYLMQPVFAIAQVPNILG